MADPTTHADHAKLATTFKANAEGASRHGNNDLAESQMVMAQWHATMAVYELMRERTGV
jgi:hypothetical protein